jgi:hypothetical protein
MTVHILHLPKFPEGSKANPDCISSLVIDPIEIDSASHLIIDTGDLTEARKWAKRFIQQNQMDPDMVTLSKGKFSKSEIGVPLLPFPSVFEPHVQVYYMPRKTLKQRIVDIF